MDGTPSAGEWDVVRIFPRVHCFGVKWHAYVNDRVQREYGGPIAYKPPQKDVGYHRETGYPAVILEKLESILSECEGTSPLAEVSRKQDSKASAHTGSLQLFRHSNRGKHQTLALTAPEDGGSIPVIIPPRDLNSSPIAGPEV